MEQTELFKDLLIVLAVAGIVLTWRPGTAALVLLVLAGAYALSVVVFYVFARYRYPLVPFLLPARGGVLYDSSALARWLDDVHPAPGGPLVPYDPTLRFVASLIDEAFDEVGLYLVHHNRWVHSARSNDAST